MRGGGGGEKTGPAGKEQDYLGGKTGLSREDKRIAGMENPDQKENAEELQGEENETGGKGGATGRRICATGMSFQDFPSRVFCNIDVFNGYFGYNSDIIDFATAAEAPEPPRTERISE